MALDELLKALKADDILEVLMPDDILEVLWADTLELLRMDVLLLEFVAIMGTNLPNGNEIGKDPKKRTNKMIAKNNSCLPIIKMKSDLETSTIH